MEHRLNFIKWGVKNNDYTTQEVYFIPILNQISKASKLEAIICETRKEESARNDGISPKVQNIHRLLF